jgi:hypothetical protein
MENQDSHLTRHRVGEAAANEVAHLKFRVPAPGACAYGDREYSSASKAMPDNNWKLVLMVLIAGASVFISQREDRRHITRYLRLGGARVLAFRKKYADRFQTFYQVDFKELNGRVMRANFSWHRKMGVSRSGDEVLKQPEDG